MNKEMYSKIVGSTFCNGQELMGTLVEGDEVKLEPEPSNKVDKNAVAVYTIDGQRLGYVPTNTAQTISPLLQHGYTGVAIVAKKTGTKDTNWGCNLLINLIEEKDFSSVDLKENPHQDLEELQ